MPEFAQYPIRFEPIFVERIWGGRKLQTALGKDLPPGKLIGESWEISDCGEHVSTVANGPLAGTRLRELMSRLASAILGIDAGPRGAVGAELVPQFPLLVKWLDTRDRLSVQVHPPDGHARLPAGERGKSECWFVVDADSAAEIFVGLKRGIDRSAFEHELSRGTADRCLNVWPARPGDFYSVPAGTVHAIGGGVLIAEIQQTSDVTLRLFDWNRLDPATGRPRELHVAAALDVIDFDRAALGPVNVAPNARSGPAAVELTPPDCREFAVTWRRIVADQPLGAADRFHVLVCIDGRGELVGGETVPIARGDCVLLPAGGPFACRPVRSLELLDARLP